MKTFEKKWLSAGAIVLAVLFIWFAIPKEKDGTLDLGDRLSECKVHVSVEPGSSDTYFKTFYCSYFTDVVRCYSPRYQGGMCTKVYQYDREP